MFRFHDVVFGYNETHPILKDINLFAKPGQKIAFVGSTGAGKTTIINLINRFYDITKGSITYDGIDVKLIKKDDLRRSLGVVLQDTHLFTGTVMDNIRYGKLDATDEECVAAASLRMQTALSECCRTDTRPFFPVTDPGFRRDSASLFPLHALLLLIRRL